MADPGRNYITSPVIDPDLRNFQGRIFKYAISTSAIDLDRFMRELVCDRNLHDKAIPPPPEHDPDDDWMDLDFDVLSVSRYEMFEETDAILEHPVDETAMEDLNVRTIPRDEEVKVIFITNFLGLEAQWPLLFFWTPKTKHLGLFLPYPPAGPDDLEEQDLGPLIPWAEILERLKSTRRILSAPESAWEPGSETLHTFAYLFMLLVKFFRGEIVDSLIDVEAMERDGESSGEISDLGLLG